MATQQGPSPDDTGLVQFQIHRGAQTEAMDGLVGTVEQIVVDRTTGELRALVIRSADGRSEFELPAQYVRRSTGDHVYLDLSKEQIANNPRLARPYDPNQYMPVYEGQMEPAPAATDVVQETGRPVVTDVGTDSAQVVAPVTPEELPHHAPPLTATEGVLSPHQAQPSQAGAPEPSRPPGASGELGGEQPSTSGVGPRSAVPPSPAPPMDTAGTERSAATFNAPQQRATPDNEEAQTTTPGMYADFTAAPEVVAPFEELPQQGMTPRPGETNAPINPTREHTAGGVLQTPISDTPLTPADAGQLTVPEQQALDESQQLFRYDEIYPQEPSRTAAQPGPDPAAPSADPAAVPLGDTGPLLGKVHPPRPAPEVSGAPGPLTPTPPPMFSGDALEQQGGVSRAAGATALAAAGLAIGAGTGVLIALLRRRARPSAAQSAVGQAAEAVTSAGKSAAQTVTEAGQTARSSLAAVNWRPRAFRWGLPLGALGGVLFAPRPGRIVRDQLAHQLNRLLSRMQAETGSPGSAQNAPSADDTQNTGRPKGTKRTQTMR